MNIIRLLSLPVAKIGTVKRLNTKRQARSPRFWVRPGRTSAWWASFVNDIVGPEEWNIIIYNSAYSVSDSSVFGRFSVFVWTVENDLDALRVDANFFENGKICLRFQTNPYTCGRGLNGLMFRASGQHSEGHGHDSGLKVRAFLRVESSTHAT